jgi:hypothetical protein
VRFRDSLPAPVPRATARNTCPEKETEPLASLDSNPLHDSGLDTSTETSNRAPAITVTNANSFGVFREYPAVSSHNPRNADVYVDAQPSLPASQSIGSGLMVAPPPESEHRSLTNSTNLSSDLILSWMATGPGNTPAGINDLVHNVIMHPEFQPSELEDFNAVTAIRRFERKHFSGAGLAVGDGWKEGSVSIRVPCTGVEQKECDAPEFVVTGILYRDPVEVITAELEDPDAFNDIHVAPFKEMWSPGPDEDPIRIYSEIYNSDAMLEADKRMRDNLSAAMAHGEDNLETFVMSALLYSDSTHLASFGTASLWPIYLFLGNVSKYTRSKPSSFSAHHIAYIPTVCR